MEEFIIENPFYKDENGLSIKHSPLTHPYSYDGFVTYDNREQFKANNTVYSDRLWQWDNKKYDEKHQEVFGNRGQMFYDSKPQDVELFLQKYFDKPNLKLTLIMQYCKRATGFPVWRFDINDKENN